MILKYRDVGARGKVDADGIVCAVVDIVLREPLAHFPRAHADDADVGQILGGIAAEDFDRQRAFFQVLGITVQDLRDDELEEILAPLTATKDRARQDPIELAAHFTGVGNAGQFMRTGNGRGQSLRPPSYLRLAKWTGRLRHREP